MNLEMFESSSTQIHSQIIGPGTLEICSPNTLYLEKNNYCKAYVAGIFIFWHITYIKKVIF